MIRRSFAVPAVASLAAASLMACRADDSSTSLLLDPGVSWQLAQRRHATLADLEYAFSLTVPADADAAVEGRGTIRFTWTDANREPLILDFLEPQRIRTVRVNDQPVPFEGVNDHVVIGAEALTPGPGNVVELEFTAGDGSLNRSDEFLYTLFVPERARFALPVFDQPNLKGRFALTLTVPEGWTAVANGPRVEEARAATSDGAAATTTMTFSASDPLPTYLFAFAAGRFEVEVAERDGRRMRLFHRETDTAKVERNLEAVFDLHGTALAWLEDYTGIEYPFQKFDFVAVPSFQYGGMEHAGAILYRASSLFLEESATQSQYLGRASLIAHETAHMWFGDLVTMNWFDDVWMKEVFASFMAAKIVQPSFPEIDHELRFLSHHQSAYEVDRTSGANAIRQPLDNLREAGTLYGPIIYQKAPVVMRLLERMVGEATFRDAMRHYLNAFAYDNATWLDLVAILDLLSPEDIAAWSRVWVEDAGRPTIEVAVRLDADGTIGALHVTQEDPRGQGRVWPQPLRVALGYGTRTEPVQAAAGGRASDAVGRPAPDFVLPESEAVGYGRFKLDDASRRVLLERVHALETPLVRGVAWLTLWDGVLEAEADPSAFLDALLRAVDTETDELNLERVLGFLETTYWTLLPDGARDERAPEIERALWARLQAAATTTLRASLFATYRDVALSPEAVDRLERVWAGTEPIDGLPMSESDLTTLAQELAVRGVEGWRTILDTQAGRIDNPDRRASFDFVRPALSADPAERAAWFEALRNPENREREPWVLTGLEYLHHPLRSEESERHVLPSLQLVEEIQRTGDIFFPSRWLVATLGRYRSPAAAETVRAFLRGRSDYPPRLEAKILQAADPLFRASAILPGDPS